MPHDVFKLLTCISINGGLIQMKHSLDGSKSLEHHLQEQGHIAAMTEGQLIGDFIETNVVFTTHR